MSEYLFCITRPGNKGVIEICGSTDDPREDSFAALRRRRAMGRFKLEWTLPVVSSDLSSDALDKVMRSYRVKREKGRYGCSPMVARGEAIHLTTLRPETNRKRIGWLRRILRAA